MSIGRRLIISATFACSLSWSYQPYAALSTAQMSYANDPVKVPVVLGVMSRCPDALLCESVFDEVLKTAGPKMTLELTFIANSNDSEPEYGATCLHGPLECAGNVAELCAIHVTSRDNWWPFVQCLNSQGRDKIGLDAISQACAKEAGIDWDQSGLSDCIKNGEGVDLLHDSIDRTNALNITKSCTIIINGIQRCIRDGSWYDCEEGHTANDFIRIIDREYDNKNNPTRDWHNRFSQKVFLAKDGRSDHELY